MEFRGGGHGGRIFVKNGYGRRREKLRGFWRRERMGK